MGNNSSINNEQQLYDYWNKIKHNPLLVQQLKQKLENHLSNNENQASMNELQQQLNLIQLQMNNLQYHPQYQQQNQYQRPQQQNQYQHPQQQNQYQQQQQNQYQQQQQNQYQQQQNQYQQKPQYQQQQQQNQQQHQQNQQQHQQNQQQHQQNQQQHQKNQQQIQNLYHNNQCSKNNQVDKKYYENISVRNNENVANNFSREYKPRNMPELRVGIPNNNVKSDFQDQYEERVRYEQNIQINKINNEVGNYNKEEAIEQFEREENYRKQQFELSQKKRREKFINELDSFNKNIINPFELLNVPENCSIEQLKKAYKQCALKYHPDKVGGNKHKFQLITKAYFSIVEKLKEKESNKSFNQLRDDSNTYIQKQESTNYKNIKLNKDGNFNIKEFNKIYSDFRLDDINDDGYGDFMERSDGLNRKDIDIPQVFSDDFNVDVFNKTFSNYKNENSSEIIVYEEPKPLDIQTNMNYSNLGDGKINSFSNDTTNNDNLKYTDYKQAHSNTMLINPNNIKKKNYSSVKELERARENISYQMSDEDLRKKAINEEKEKILEENRLNRILKKDKQIDNHYHEINNLMLNQ